MSSTWSRSSLTPRLLLIFQCCRKKNKRAWKSKSRDEHHACTKHRSNMQPFISAYGHGLVWSLACPPTRLNYRHALESRVVLHGASTAFSQGSQPLQVQSTSVTLGDCHFYKISRSWWCGQEDPNLAPSRLHTQPQKLLQPQHLRYIYMTAYGYIMAVIVTSCHLVIFMVFFDILRLVVILRPCSLFMTLLAWFWLPGSLIFLCATLKNWEEPGDKANQGLIQDFSSRGRNAEWCCTVKIRVLG